MNISLLSKQPRDAGFGASAGNPKTWVLGGALAGSATGGLAGLAWSRAKVKELPVNSKTVNWDEPVTDNTVLGVVPDTRYEPGAYGSSSAQVTTHNVMSVDYGGTNRLDPDGHVLTHTVTRTYTDHGVPVVARQERPVQSACIDPRQPYVEVTQADTHRVLDSSYYDSNGVLHENTHEEIEGYWHYFHPNVHYLQQQLANGSSSYQVPTVHFETGVHTVANVLGGAVAGALVGAGVGYVLNQALAR